MVMDRDRIAALAKFFTEVRTRKGLSFPEIRRRGGPSVGWLGSLETQTIESIPKPSTLERLAKGLGVPYEDVLRAAGMMPGEGEAEGVSDAEFQELLEITRALPPADREELLMLARMKLQRQQRP